MINQELTANLYREMQRIRRAEEVIEDIYPTDKIKSPVHLAIGHEAIEVGVCSALAKSDVVFGYYRSHGLYLAKGGNMAAMMAELYGKVDGCSRGKGGSMHLVDVDNGVMGTSAIVASSISNAVGYAYAIKYKQTKQVAVSFFGDGATEEGVWGESLNFAALKKLPVLFVCINNGLAIYTHQHKRQALTDIQRRAQAHGLETCKIISNDVFEIYQQVQKIVELMRQGHGPFFIECQTARWRDHVGPGEDFKLGYRDPDEIHSWVQQDQITRLGSMLGQQQKDFIDQSIESEIKSAVAFAESSPFPETKELYQHVYK